MGFFSDLFASPSSSTRDAAGDATSRGFSKSIEKLAGTTLRSKVASPTEKKMAGSILGSIEKKPSNPK